MLINTLIERMVADLKPGSQDIKDLKYTAAGGLVYDLKEFIEQVFANPQEFADRLGMPQCELFTPKELIAVFNEVYDHETKSFLYITRILPKERFAAGGDLISLKRVINGTNSRKFVAIKNEFMWHKASKEQVIQHLIRTRK